MTNLRLMGIAVVALAGAASANAIVFDCAFDPAYNDGWQTGDNGGTGFGAWTLVESNNAGHFVGSSNNNGGGGGPGIDTVGKSWGAWANNGESSGAQRSLLSAVAVGETFFAYLDNGWIESGGQVFVGLTAPGASSMIRFANGTSNYELVDSAGNTTSSIGFTDRGLLAEWTVTSASSYDFKLTSLSNIASWTTSRTIANAAFDRMSFQNDNAGSFSERDAFLNSVGVVPEPGTIAALGLGLGALLRKRRK